MLRFLVYAGAACLLVSSVAAAQEIQRGKIKKIDLEKKTVIITTIDGRDHDFSITEHTRFMDAAGKSGRNRLKERGFQTGARVLFKAGNNGELIGLKLADDGKGGHRGSPVKVDTSKLKPLTELGTDKYHGFKGGLYLGGKNERPRAHEKAGLALAKQVQPLDHNGKPSPDGRIVLMSIGMSNTSQAFSAFQRLADADADKNPKLLLVNGAQGGMTAFAIQNPNDRRSGTRYWTEVDQRLRRAGATRAQVEAVWIKQADAGPNQGFPKYAQNLEAELAKIVQILPKRFPNIKLVYLSSRTYGGYARTRLNPEPYAYESGFSVKWLIERQLKGDPALNYDPAKGRVTAPWLSWGPYLWANGSKKRRDGFRYEESDFAQDGTHESPTGQRKIGKLMLQFFKTDSTTRGWFVGK